MRSYTVRLWDHDPADDGSERGEWSGELARAHLGRSNEGLTWREIGQAIRKLRSCGWSEVSVYVEREDGTDATRA